MADIYDSLLTPEQIKTLTTVAERGSFNKAASSLGVSQSAITQIVARLEQRLERRIFHRSPNGVTLTIEGEAVLIYVQSMVKISQELVRHLRTTQVEATLSVGITEDVSRTALPAVLGLFIRQHKNVRLSVFSALSDAVFDRYDQDKLDVAVARRHPEQLRGEVLWREDTVWVAGPEFTLAPDESLPLVIPPPGITRSTVMAALQGSKHRWHVAFESESLSTLEAAVHAGLGVSAAPSSMELFKLVHLDDSMTALPRLSSSLFVLEKRPAPQTLFAEAFCEMFREVTRLSYGKDIA